MKKNDMNSRILSLITSFVVVLSVVGCTIPNNSHKTRSPTFTTTQTPLPPSNGPQFLIQTGLNSYQIIDVHQHIAIPFDPPGEDKRYDLAKHISPSGSLMFFPNSNGSIIILDFKFAEWHNSYELNNFDSLFKPEKAAEEALETLPGWDKSYQSLLSAIKDALVLSRMNIQWYQSDRYLLSVLEDSKTSTHLYRNDLYTQTHHQLEDLPGLVQDFWIAPDERCILLKKGVVFEPNLWQDDNYYLINVDAQTAKSITLPQDVNHPSLSWLDSQFIGITHQTQPLGGIGFTVFNSTTMESTQIIEGAFTQIQLIEGSLLVLKQEQESHTTSLKWLDFNGQSIQSISFDHICIVTSIINGDILLNCETESLIINEAFQSQSFGDPIFLLSIAPDRQTAALVTRNEQVFLMDGDLKERQPLPLDGSPLEIRWLPDSSGFLYRTGGKLYHYDLHSKASQLLVASDLFNDYSNTNAVWISVD